MTDEISLETYNADPLAHNGRVIAAYRASGGRLDPPLDGSRLVLLTTIGARTGQPRTTPIGVWRDGERLVVFASANGAAAHPAWYHNLVANPDATVEHLTQTFPVRARPATGQERDRLWKLFSFPSTRTGRPGRSRSSSWSGGPAREGGNATPPGVTRAAGAAPGPGRRADPASPRPAGG